MKSTDTEHNKEQLSAFSEMSQQFGENYLNLLGALSDTESSSQERSEALKTILSRFPEKLQPVIQDALKRAIDSIKQNEKIIRELLKTEKLPNNSEGLNEFHKTLLAYALQNQPDTFKQIYEILDHNIESTRVSSGMYTVTLNETALQQLKDLGVISRENGRFMSVPTTHGNYSFVILQENSAGEVHNKSVKYHEYHHFIYNALREGEGLRVPQERDKKMSAAFEEARDELVAYVVDSTVTGHIDFGDLVATSLSPTHGGDYKIAKEIYTVLHALEEAIKLAKSKGQSPEIFIYPLFTSRTFGESITRIQKVTTDLASLNDITPSTSADSVPKSKKKWWNPFTQK